MTLYNCKHAGEQYRITKFSDDMNVESSYLCTFEECQCPAGQKPICRHRQMLPKFIERKAVDINWMYDYDRGGWVDNRTEDDLVESHSTVVSAEDFDSSDVGSNPAVTAKWRRF